ncbi:MAG: dihydroneopterin aldolase [Aestuariivirgaceae bacterium]|nr:dihydroneopterin aldolase [Aestuariivirgaceae bacterium]
MSEASKISHHVASGRNKLRHVFVRDLRLMALIGVYEIEKITPQPIVVNIDLSVAEGSQPTDDDLKHVVSYEIIVKKVEAILAQGHINLVETLAERIAEACLSDARVEAARVRVEKPEVIPNAASVGVEIERDRS